MVKYNRNIKLLLVLVKRILNNNLLGCIHPSNKLKLSRCMSKNLNFDVLNIIINFIGYEFIVDKYVNNLNLYNIVKTINDNEGIIGLFISFRQYPNYNFSYDKYIFKTEDYIVRRNIIEVIEFEKVHPIVNKKKRIYKQSFVNNNKKNLNLLLSQTVSRIKSILIDGKLEEKLKVLEVILSKYLTKKSKFKRLDDTMDFNRFRLDLLKFYRHIDSFMKIV